MSPPRRKRRGVGRAFLRQRVEQSAGLDSEFFVIKRGFSQIRSKSYIRQKGFAGACRRSRSIMPQIRRNATGCPDNRREAELLFCRALPLRRLAASFAGKRIYWGAEGTMAEFDQGELLVCRVAPNDIDLFNKLLEGYDNLALVTTLDSSLGRMALRFAAAAKKDLLAVIHCLPIPVAIETV